MTTPSLRAGDFVGREGQVFRASAASQVESVELTLTSVTTWGPPVEAGQRQPFTILLAGPLEPMLPQSTYRFDHPAMGSFDIFIVPIGREPAGMRYEAVFA